MIGASNNATALRTSSMLKVSYDLKQLYEGKVYADLREYLLRIHMQVMRDYRAEPLPAGIELGEIIDRHNNLLLPDWLQKMKPTVKCAICGKPATAVAVHDRGGFFELAGSVGKNFACTRSACRHQLKYNASLGHGNATFRSASFNIFNLRTSRKVRISFKLAWQIICLAYEIPEEYWQENSIQKRIFTKNSFMPQEPVFEFKYL
jgi:hypothetical protein